MIKNVAFTLLALFALIGLLGGIKAIQIRDLISAASTMTPPPATVATHKVEKQTWEVSLDAVASLEAVQGVVIAADIPGRVTEIYFTPGSRVEKGAPLIQQDVTSETAQLRAAEANVELARVNVERVRELYTKRASSKADLDTSEARYKEAQAQADTFRTSIAKKTLKAPFWWAARYSSGECGPGSGERRTHCVAAGRGHHVSQFFSTATKPRAD
ncbi:MAG: biotin/lipoyl-binding protein [Cellvibrionaceae bacterium]|nr:biotin/lipoyl-binding protein [Cellvibrionaceae bacterium]